MKILAAFTLAHLNIRKEKAGDDATKTAADLKFTSELGAGDCSTLFGTESSFQRLLGNLWNDEGELTTTDLKKIVLTSEIVGGKAILTPEFSSPASFEGVGLNKIVLEPKAGRRVDVSMRLQVHPTKEQISQLSEWLGNDLTILVDRVQGELPLDTGRAVKAKRGAQADLH